MFVHTKRLVAVIGLVAVGVMILSDNVTTVRISAIINLVCAIVVAIVSDIERQLDQKRAALLDRTTTQKGSDP